MAKTEIDPPEFTLSDLRRMTQARIQLGRFGAGLPTRALQSFLLDHARARQAVWSQVDRSAFRIALSDLPLEVVNVESMAENRGVYVRRPDLGRKLSADAMHRLETLPRGCDVVIVVADGLSANAVMLNAAPLVRAIVRRLENAALTVAPLMLAAQARVALADPIGEQLRARVSIILIGERPGLSSADSLGAYITYGPAKDTLDSRRNCVSNIRDGGLSIDDATHAIIALVVDMLRAGVSGVALQDAVAKLPPQRAFLNSDLS